MNLLLPCAGRSTRYGKGVPKYLLSMPDNRVMLEKSAEPFLGWADRILVTILKEHEEAFGIRAILKEVCPAAEVFILDQVTRGQAETVYLTLERFDVQGSFLVKDCDSAFVPERRYEAEENFVSVCSLRDIDVSRPYQKSFVNLNEQGYIIGITEKRITSELFSCGGYHFASPGEFRKYFRILADAPIQQEMYLSPVIDLMIQDKVLFRPMLCKNYCDWGVYEDWISYRAKFRTYIFDVDCILVVNGSRHIQPRWGETPAITGAGEKLRTLKSAGHYILLVTSRPEAYREATLRQMEQEGIIFDQLVMGVNHGPRYVVNDYSSTMPYPTALAINSARDSGDWVEKV